MKALLIKKGLSWFKEYLMGFLWRRLGFLAHFWQGPVLGRVPILVKGPSSPSIRLLGPCLCLTERQQHSVHATC